MATSDMRAQNGATDFPTAGEAVLILDGGMKILAANDQAARRFGVRPGDLIGQSLSGLDRPGARMRHIDGLARLVLRTGKGRSVPVKLRALGRMRRFEMSLVPMTTGGNGGFVTLTLRPVVDLDAMSKVMRDATREADHVLRENEQRLRDFLDCSSDWVWETDADHCFTLVQSNASDPDFEPPIGLTRWEAACADPDTDPHWHEHRAVMQAHQPIKDFIYGYDDEGRVPLAWFAINGLPRFDVDGAFLGYRGTSRDVTELVNARERMRIVIDNVAAGIIIQDAQGLIFNCNREAERLLGLSREQIVGRSSLEAGWGAVRADGSPFPCDEHPSMVALRTGAPVDGVVMGLPLPDGEVRWVSINARVLAPAHGRNDRSVIISFIDITAARRHAQELAAAHARTEAALAELSAYKAALDQHSLVAIADRNGIITYVNDLFCAVSQFSREELIGRSHRVINSDLHDKAFFRALWATISKGESWQGEICNRAKDGSTYWVDTTIMPVRGDDGEIAHYVVIRQDITARKRAEQIVKAEIDRRTRAESLLRDVVDAIPDGIAAFDAEDRLIVFNSAYVDFYRQSAAMIRTGVHFEDLIRHGIREGQYRGVGDSESEHEAWIAGRLAVHRNPGPKVIQHLADGRWLQVHECRSASGNLVGVRTDITSLKAAEAAMKRHAAQDGLTGLPNRSVMFEHLSGVLTARRHSDAASGALLLVDLDHFKDVNDTLGHDAGDALLREVAQRFVRIVRSSDLVVRLGGDEFGIVLNSPVGPAEVGAVVDKLLKGMAEPMVLGDRTIKPQCSIGVSMFPGDAHEAGQLFKNADIALYQAKALGRGTWCFFDPAMRQNVDRRLMVTQALREALVTGAGLTIALQPQVRMSTSAHMGFEALVRWNHRGQMISPAEFIPIAEETGQIVQIGSLVLRHAAAAMRRLLDDGLDPGQVAVNVAAMQLKDSGFVDEVSAVLDQFGLEPSRLELEVTETVLLDRSATRIGATLRALHELGVSIALDDFGTGYASLSHLKQFPVDRLKIDQSFVRDIGTDPEDAAIARTIINLAHSLDMEVVAEGIETAEQLEFLRAQGCDLAQGYYFARPLAFEAAEAHLREARRAGERAASALGLQDVLAQAFGARPADAPADPVRRDGTTG